MTRAEWNELNELAEIRDTTMNAEVRDALEALIDSVMDQHNAGPSSWPNNWDGACTDCNTGITEVFDLDGKIIKTIHAIDEETPAA